MIIDNQYGKIYDFMVEFEKIKNTTITKTKTTKKNIIITTSDNKKYSFALDEIYMRY